MRIDLSHGNGARETSLLIETVFMRVFKNRYNQSMEDAAILDIDLQAAKKQGGGEPGRARLAFTTDSFVVKPLFFPGADIGRLAVCGTVNDILTTGAKPLYLSASFIIEEGMQTEELFKIAMSMQEAADEAGVFIVAGDTKVIEGNGGLYINTTGIGVLGEDHFTTQSVCESDSIIVTGTMGDHHACILSSRMEIKNDIKSDAAPLVDIVNNLKESGVKVHAMRDITRGGLATVLNEIAGSAGLLACMDEEDIPVSASVRGFCEILGLDPIYMGNEGKMLVIVPEHETDKALRIMRDSEYGQNTSVVGRFYKADPVLRSFVVMNTRIGGRRLVLPLSGEGLPRIC